ncbi:hypothetical protein SLAVM298S_05575 [Streptomyces lavendulae subsp. lavendulae]
MGEDVRETVDRRDDPRGVTPWDRAPWRAAALAWAGSALAAHGLRETGERRVRLRPWSVLARISVEDGEPVWFKANPPASAFEAGLTEALSRWPPPTGCGPWPWTPPGAGRCCRTADRSSGTSWTPAPPTRGPGRSRWPGTPNSSGT